ncbi:cell envelope integrity protein TolA [Cupriavidus sp. WKF15]|uniref:cell envelope integrity protein TolA n=1 Tax=Cupriavidus sp. WKF15 TaxID=3032282 RepID=UPI0023E1F692|nr:cell envelope integrity protein TolA [Cupriavidus sp. WKF15]WER48786.1 cell envelope integrity protein TolA [Cupriavidus sp. WKF15]
MQTGAFPFQPVRERGTLICFLAALFMHLLLGALLYYGVHWRSTAPEGVSAEMWDPIPEAVQSQPESQPEVKPAPSVKPVEQENADIALQEKARKAERAAQDEQKAREKAQEKAQHDAQARAEAARKAAQREAQEAQRQAANAERASELSRLRAQAGGANASTGTGTSGKPSSAYAERVRQRVKPNIIFAEDINGNPAAVVAVRMAPDGSILSARLAKSSGNSGWDNAVLRAVTLSDPLPRDENGVAPPEIRITFWPKDQGSS